MWMTSMTFSILFIAGFGPDSTREALGVGVVIGMLGETRNECLDTDLREMFDATASLDSLICCDWSHSFLFDLASAKDLH
mmetsp:Transcript_24831/g.51916  ORF Transcript_24831/g.51916 Transcript_24831/m.51916 type:complete len:80 (+) Transcript_24831:123-362(+)